ncbi:MAG: translation initiation factor IF-6 [Methanosarcinaceae archaeon]|nr:translation initiation factor IF-6 [Methanosarcinaceae archaeon]
MIRTLDIFDNPVIGVFATCTEDVALVPISTQSKVCDLLAKFLDVRVIPVLIGGSTVVGSLVRGNSNGFLIPNIADPDDLKDVGLPINTLPGKLSAVGNIVLANDSAALVHSEMSNEAIKVVSDTLGVDVHRGTIAGLNTVGMAGMVTNKGLLVHPRATQAEIENLENVFGLPVSIGTSNFGSQQVGSGVLANSKGYVAGSKTTGHELGRIADALELIDVVDNS